MTRFRDPRTGKLLGWAVRRPWADAALEWKVYDGHGTLLCLAKDEDEAEGVLMREADLAERAS